MTVRTRFAPSPTGYAHLGFVSRVLINYALAKKNDGQFIWRNEDTDQERFVEDALEFNMKWMREFNLDWDEGPDKGGPYAPYTQSERLPLYKVAAEKLIENGYAYRCFMTKEELEQLQKLRQATKTMRAFRSMSRDLTTDQVKAKLDAGESYTVRLKIPEDKVFRFTDGLSGKVIEWQGSEVGDQVILKSDGFPTYHLAVVVDDHDMKISHVLRGSEWVSSTPLHLHIYEGLGYEIPFIGHFTVILDPETRKKFSKRKSSFRVNGLVQQGYLKPAILNYLMLLGWSPGNDRELFSLDEFVDAFSLDGMQSSDPLWNQKKMDWFNGVYMRDLSLEEFVGEFKLWIEKYLVTATPAELANNFINEECSELQMYSLIELAKQLLDEELEELAPKLALVHERAVNLWHALSQIEFFYRRPENIDWEIKQVKKISDVRTKIKDRIVELVTNLDNESSKWTHESWETEMRKIGDDLEVKHGDVFMVLRMYMCGGPFSPPLFEAMQLLGKQETLQRLQ